jgi:recombination protein RecA
LTRSKPWTRLDQALRATDLLLQAGGFAAIVLDLGDMEPAHAMRIPLTTWFRFRQAADRTRCSLVVLGKTDLCAI